MFIISAVPAIELRGGIIVGQQLGMPLLGAFITGILGTTFPVIFILLFFRFILNKFKKFNNFIGRFFLWLERRVASKAAEFGKWRYVGLALFAAVPVPLTGAWTGSMVAAFLGLRIKHSFIAIFLGIIGCAVIISLLSYGLLDFIIRQFA